MLGWDRRCVGPPGYECSLYVCERLRGIYCKCGRVQVDRDVRERMERRRSEVGCVRLAVAGCALVCVVGLLGSALSASALACENEQFRVGPSRNLPDCRAYELVTPTDLGRTQDMTFTGADHAVPSSDGEHIALLSIAALEPSPSAGGTQVVFARTATGWQMHSATTPGDSVDDIAMGLFSDDLSQVALESRTALNFEEYSAKTLEVGPVGGPYVTMAESVPSGFETNLAGANTGAAGVPAFSDVLFSSSDHALLALGTERDVAEEAVEGANDLYDWTGGQLRLVNVKGEGSNAEALNRCGAVLGEGFPGEGPGAVGAVSADGSKIFFTSPEPTAGRLGTACEEPSHLYMRVDGRETVEVSAPQYVSVEPSERKAVYYAGATPDGAMVFFDTETPLTAGETLREQGELKLFGYDTVTHVLTLIASGVERSNGSKRFFDVSENGSTVYYEKNAGGREHPSEFSGSLPLRNGERKD